MKPCVFIHTNHRQLLGAIVGRYALERNSAHAGDFDVRLIEVDDAAFMRDHEGRLFLRDGERREWRNDDLQSFTPLRFMPPQLMNYQGRAVVTDPDVFAIGDVWELLSRDLQGKAILCRARTGARARRGRFASSVMVLDCARLRHWDVEAQFRQMFDFRLDYVDWMSLRAEAPDTIGSLENEWNDFDHLGPATRMLHNTRRYTQPWKTGLPIDFRPADTLQLFPPRNWLRRARRALFGDYGFAGRYRPHPDPRQESLFFGLLRECLDGGIVSEAQLQHEMRRGHLRRDAFEVLRAVEPAGARSDAAPRPFSRAPAR